MVADKFQLFVIVFLNEGVSLLIAEACVDKVRDECVMREAQSVMLGSTVDHF